MKIKRFILKWIWLVPLIIWIALTVQAKLSDDTKELVDDLRWKHYGHSITDNILTFDPLDHWSYSINFDNGRLTIETQDGTWFIEMRRKEE